MISNMTYIILWEPNSLILSFVCMMSQKLEIYLNILNCAFNLHCSEIMYGLSANDPCVTLSYCSCDIQICVCGMMYCIFA